MGDNDTSETQQSAPEPEPDQEQAEVVDQQTELLTQKQWKQSWLR
ncbi:MAG: hypothetical protein CM15mP120_23450 [Pseudomonadota bacterium]|nr:MAG: hypothetical protein CM15mP120_23450 [Pseudomonadota bacterium]